MLLAGGLPSSERERLLDERRRLISAAGDGQPTAPPRNPPPSTSDERVVALAALIAGEQVPPDWLLTGLEKAVSAVRFVIQSEARHPDRGELQERLKKLIEAARHVLVALDDGVLMREISAATGTDPTGGEGVFHGLVSLTEAAETTLRAVPERQGSDKHDSGRSPQSACALVVAFAWRATRGEDIKHTSAAARDACRHLWEIAGGAAQGHGGSQTTAGWLPHIKKAKGELTAGDASEFASLFPACSPKST